MPHLTHRWLLIIKIRRDKPGVQCWIHGITLFKPKATGAIWGGWGSVSLRAHWGPVRGPAAACLLPRSAVFSKPWDYECFQKTNVKKKEKRKTTCCYFSGEGQCVLSSSGLVSVEVVCETVNWWCSSHPCGSNLCLKKNNKQSKNKNKKRPKNIFRRHLFIYWNVLQVIYSWTYFSIWRCVKLHSGHM